MTVRSLPVWTAMAAAVLSVSAAQAEQKAPPTAPQAWSLDEAIEQANLNPEDAYLQYVALQLARNEDRTQQVVNQLRRTNRRGRRPPNREADLFALFTAAHAVQETLQLDTMLTDEPGLTGHVGDRSHETAKISTLQGPQVASHPWGKMLAAQTVSGKRPEVGPLAMCVPEDQYFVLFRSVEKLLQASELGDLWGAHLFSQATRSAKSFQTSDRLKTQLAVQTDPLTRPFYDLVVEEVAITGGDLYFRVGTDTTLLFQIREPQVFRLRMDGFLDAAEKSRPDAVRTTGEILGVPYVHVGTPDREIYVFSAYPKPNLHVRANSKGALERALETIAGKTADGEPAPKPLGQSTEFKYIRTLMVRGAEEEDGFVYLSDPFIRRVVGPELKLTHRRRMLCYNHLRMIGHAAMLYRTQYGRSPESLEQLAESGCAPGVFGEGKLRCPDGGDYRLSEDATYGVCSHHGHAQALVPCGEVPVVRVTESEAQQYREFVNRYSQYWRRFFDPIAVRIQIAPEKYRAETIILPLIDNSIYTGLAATLGGEPEPLDTLPVPKRNIFTIAFRVNKELLLSRDRPSGLFRIPLFGSNRRSSGQWKPDEELARAFLSRGIGSQVGMHVYDAPPTFDFNLTRFLGEVLGRFRGGWFGDGGTLYISFLIASLNSPVYVSLPVEDPAIVDRFLEHQDAFLAALARAPRDLGFFELDFDFYRVAIDGVEDPIRCFNVQFGPVKWRMFYARIGDGLYLASKRFILEDLAAMEKTRSKGDAAAEAADQGPPAHAMVRIRPEHWDHILANFRLGWAEASRESCLNNLGPLSSVGRSVSASDDGTVDAKQILQRADDLHAVHFFCPDGGQYELSPDGKQMICPVHGSAIRPRQLAAPAPKSPLGQLLDDLGGVTVSLTFLEDGLHAVAEIERK